MLPAESKKKDVKTRVLRFLTDADIVLNSEEELILSRWEVADHLMRQKKEETEIVAALMERFGISRFTADNDITNAQEIFSKSRKLNKKYVIHLHIQRIDRAIEKIYDKIMFRRDEVEKGVHTVTELVPDAKEIAGLAKLFDSYTYALNSIPETIEKIKLPPPIFMFTLPKGETFVAPMSINDALAAANEYLDFENLDDQPNEE